MCKPPDPFAPWHAAQDARSGGDAASIGWPSRSRPGLKIARPFASAEYDAAVPADAVGCAEDDPWEPQADRVQAASAKASCFMARILPTARAFSQGGDAVPDAVEAGLRPFCVQNRVHPFLAMREAHRVERAAQAAMVERRGEIRRHLDGARLDILAQRE